MHSNAMDVVLVYSIAYLHVLNLAEIGARVVLSCCVYPCLACHLSLHLVLFTYNWRVLFKRNMFGFTVNHKMQHAFVMRASGANILRMGRD